MAEYLVNDLAQYASEYGHSSTSYIDCNSAISILGFIMFVDIIRDIIEYITEAKRRRKRSSDTIDPLSGGYPPSEILTYVSKDGISPLLNSLPGEASKFISCAFDSSGSCVSKRVCEVNKSLAIEHGVTGRVIATFLSNIISKSMYGNEKEGLRKSLEAARKGRRLFDCSSTEETTH